MCELIHLLGEARLAPVTSPAPRSPHYSRSLRSRLNHTPAPHTTEPPAPHAPRTSPAHHSLTAQLRPRTTHAPYRTHAPPKETRHTSRSRFRAHVPRVRLARLFLTALMPVCAPTHPRLILTHTLAITTGRKQAQRPPPERPGTLAHYAPQNTPLPLTRTHPQGKQKHQYNGTIIPTI